MTSGCSDPNIIEIETIVQSEEFIETLIELEDDTIEYQIILEESTDLVLEVVDEGPQGSRGEPGLSGAGFVYTQSSAATLWTINHNLGFYPAVSTFTVGGLEMLGDIQHMSLNTVRITFTSAVAGTARLV